MVISTGLFALEACPTLASRGTNLQSNSRRDLVVNRNGNPFADLNAHSETVANRAIKSFCQFRSDHSEVQRLVNAVYACPSFTFVDFVLYGSTNYGTPVAVRSLDLQ